MNILTAPEATAAARGPAWTPEAAAAHIAALLAEACEVRDDMRRTPRSQHRRLYREIDALHCQIDAERHRCAEAFGAGRGWRLSSTHFNPDVLARRGVRGRPALYQWPYPEGDHVFLYRTQDRRAAGAAAHIYALTAAGRARCRRWAVAQELRIEFPAEPVSWWWPGSTALVVYTPAGAAEGAA